MVGKSSVCGFQGMNQRCDSGVVGNARPCQGRDRGFEPRLSLYYPDLLSGFFIIEAWLSLVERCVRDVALETDFPTQ